jgi:hypothetical protein
VSVAAALALRTVAFGDLDVRLWGCVQAGADAVATAGSTEAGSEADTVSVALEGSSASEPWHVTGSGLELTVAAASPPASWSEPEGFDQLCRVRGQAQIAGSARTLDCFGWRSARSGLELTRLDSVRVLAAWFADEEGMSLSALRPAGARGHDRDAVHANWFEPASPLVVAEPRLSTTYARSGLPLHAGVELWLQAEDEQEQYPRRAQGDAVGVSARLQHDATELLACPLRWHSRGSEGTGIYLLSTPSRG